MKVAQGLNLSGIFAKSEISLNGEINGRKSVTPPQVSCYLLIQADRVSHLCVSVVGQLSLVQTMAYRVCGKPLSERMMT